MRRIERVEMIRQHAVPFAMTSGHWESIGTHKHIVAECWPLKLSYRTPFQRPFTAKKVAKYWLALRNQNANLAYGLNIWFEDIPEDVLHCPAIERDFTSSYVRKVLNVEWDGRGNVEVLSFRRGRWESLAFLSEVMQAS